MQVAAKKSDFVAIYYWLMAYMDRQSCRGVYWSCTFSSLLPVILVMLRWKMVRTDLVYLLAEASVPDPHSSFGG